MPPQRRCDRSAGLHKQWPYMKHGAVPNQCSPRVIAWAGNHSRRPKPSSGAWNYLTFKHRPWHVQLVFPLFDIFVMIVSSSFCSSVAIKMPCVELQSSAEVEWYRANYMARMQG